jgi:ribonuclease E
MLIDARHREETRVAVLHGNRIEEFDFESAEHKQLKGNIYLAKVTRVEPSLQAAFIEYGGNRHGFLAFSEIHPDYYQIPQEDREQLLREEAEHAAEEAAMRAEEDIDELEGEVEDVVPPAPLDEDGNGDHDDDEAHDEDDQQRGGRRARNRGRGGKGSKRRPSDELKDKRMALRRRYKIQDVIKRRQVMLVQVVKEERGNKGAALTTYLSLAGRYCVLMPNTSHGGGISRKISNSGDRKRLKSIIDDLNLPPSVGCIIRTAGLQRTKPEIKRDFDYLARLWDGIRENTLGTTAPALIHSDSDLIKRAIRDIYNREISEVLVEGEDGYRAAKDFMKLLMPSHAKRVQHYADPVPLFQRYGAEDQLSAMYQPVVQLKSGGYLVINPTEALVSIDINSGRSTKEHGIEATALGTNLEAAREIARQLRLRDMAGLVVIDFIDMESNGNVRKVERAMKDALKNDRARIQVGRISGFGLMEMSRQRLRTGVLEASTRECPHCEGTGLVRTASSAALSVLRLLEEEAAKGKGTRLSLRTSQEASYYVLNTKRDEIAELEHRYGVKVEILPDGETEGARMTIDVSGPRPEHMPSFESLVDDDDDVIDDEPDYGDDEDDDDGGERNDGGRDRDRDEGGRDRNRKSRSRRGGRNRSRGDRPDGERSDRDRPARERSESDRSERPERIAATSAGDDGEAASDDARGDRTPRADHDAEGDGNAPKRRRGRRGGRRRRGGARDDARDGGSADAGENRAPRSDEADGHAFGGDATPERGDAKPERSDAKPERSDTSRAAPAASIDAAAGSDDDDKPKTRRRPRARKAEPAAPAKAAAEAAETSAEAPAEKPKRASRARKPKVAAEPTGQGDSVAAKPVVAAKADTPAKVARAKAPAAKPAAKAAEPAKAEGDAPAKSPRKPAARSKAKAPPATSATPDGKTVDSDGGDGSAGGDGEGRRGWWQRTFGT